MLGISCEEHSCLRTAELNMATLPYNVPQTGVIDDNYVMKEKYSKLIEKYSVWKKHSFLVIHL